MKRLFLAAGLAAVLIATGGASCAPTAPVEITTPAKTTIDEKALFALEASYNVVGTSYLAAVDTGMLTGARKDEAKLNLDLAHGALLRARTAYEIGNAESFEAQAGFIRTVLDLARRQIPIQSR